jgi:SagB-type dehydrogenase family enzyme
VRAPLRAIRDYHAATQHHEHRFADALGYLDWATQPDPFRSYAGAERLELPLQAPTGAPRWRELFAGVPPAPIDRASIGRLFQDSMALSAWKEYGASRWALRVNPSSGNLHPTEGYLLCGPVAGLAAEPALYHYAPAVHALERRAAVPSPLWQRLVAALPADALLIGLSSIPWREAWKYGERAYRYCMHDVGHALGALAFAAAALGWRTALLPVPDDRLAVLLGIDGSTGPEAEHADALLVVHRDADPLAGGARAFARDVLDDALLAGFAALPRHGTPNRLSPDHHHWPLLDEAIAASRLLAPPPPAFWDRPAPLPPALVPPDAPDADARALFHQRRSAVAMDGRSAISLSAFAAALQRAASASSPPFALLPWRSRVHLLLFVHRVTGLPPGLYCLARGGREPDWLRARMRPDFLWERVDGVPAELPLFLLLPIDCRAAAAAVACRQEIAADGAFALGMLAEFAGSLQELGPWAWRLLHWEAGAIGQLLYLEAEAVGLRATGIGCFFDPMMHDLLRLDGDDLRTIYHFAVGGPVDDPRLRTGPPYPAR